MTPVRRWFDSELIYGISCFMSYAFQVIGRVHSCFKAKFGIPRQAGLVPDARGTLELVAPFNRREYLAGLEAFSHIWLVYVFHAATMKSGRSSVRPPRLGGNQRLGVFATRSNYRPNPVGLSLVALDGISHAKGTICLQLKGIDLLDGTPVLDIKPYLPYTDCRPKALCGFAQAQPAPLLQVRFEAPVRDVLGRLAPPEMRLLARLIVQVLQLDPRPAYLAGGTSRREFGTRLMDWNVRWRLVNRTATVMALVPWDDAAVFSSTAGD